MPGFDVTGNGIFPFSLESPVATRHGALECFGSISHSSLNYTKYVFAELLDSFVTSRRPEGVAYTDFINISDSEIIKKTFGQSLISKLRNAESAFIPRTHLSE